MSATTPPDPGNPADAPRLPTGIWAAVPTPMLPDGKLDLAGIAGNAQRFQEDLGLQGIFCNGLMGEQWSLTVAERKRILETTIGATGGALKVGVVVSAATLTDTLSLTRHAGKQLAHHVVLMRPAGFRHEPQIEAYVRAVAAVCDVPVLLFDGGASTGGFAAPLVARLARDGVIQGVKSTRGDDSAEALRNACEDTVAVMDPYESHWLNNLLRFDQRVLYADPEPYLFQLSHHRGISDYFQAYIQDDLDQATRGYRALEPLRALYFRWIMGPLQLGHPINAVLKRWFGAMGFAAGPVRAPLAALSNAQASRFDAELSAAFRQVLGPEFTFPTRDALTWIS